MTIRKVAGRGTKKCSSEASGNRTINKQKKAKLKRDTLTISASEVNRFTYCQYQWYYERLYGRTELGKRYRERNQQPNQRPNQQTNLKNTAEGNFSRGRAYHKNEYLSYRLKHARTKALILTFILMFVLAAIYLWVRMG